MKISLNFAAIQQFIVASGGAGFDAAFGEYDHGLPIGIGFGPAQIERVNWKNGRSR